MPAPGPAAPVFNPVLVAGGAHGLSEECISEAGRLGECASAQHCGATRGLVDGLCHQGLDGAATPDPRVCCIYPQSCGDTTSRSVTYFQSPGHPSEDCTVTVRLQPGACQLRLDFIDFRLPPLVDGACSPHGRIVLSSSAPHAFLPVKELCGTLAETPADPTRTDLPHLYLHAEDQHPERPEPQLPDAPARTVTLRAAVRDTAARWNIRLSQVQCDGAELQAPPGCGQYYTGQEGAISSLNWRDGHYPADLHLAACIKPDLSACAVHYSLRSLGLSRTGGTKLGYGLSCRDYIVFHGERTGLCGAVSAPRDLVLPAQHSLLGLTMATDGQHVTKEDVGFDLTYKFLHNCTGVPTFKYPSVPRKAYRP